MNINWFIERRDPPSLRGALAPDPPQPIHGGQDEGYRPTARMLVAARALRHRVFVLERSAPRRGAQSPPPLGPDAAGAAAGDGDAAGARPPNVTLFGRHTIEQVIGVCGNVRQRRHVVPARPRREVRVGFSRVPQAVPSETVRHLPHAEMLITCFSNIVTRYPLRVTLPPAAAEAHHARALGFKEAMEPERAPPLTSKCLLTYVGK